jgi:hypothetical protein
MTRGFQSERRPQMYARVITIQGEGRLGFGARIVCAFLNQSNKTSTHKRSLGTSHKGKPLTISLLPCTTLIDLEREIWMRGGEHPQSPITKLIIHWAQRWQTGAQPPSEWNLSNLRDRHEGREKAQLSVPNICTCFPLSFLILKLHVDNLVQIFANTLSGEG